MTSTLKALWYIRTLDIDRLDDLEVELFRDAAQCYIDQNEKRFFHCDEMDIEDDITITKPDGEVKTIKACFSVVITLERGWKYNRKHLIHAMTGKNGLFRDIGWSDIFEDIDRYLLIREALGPHFRNVVREVESRFYPHICIPIINITPPREKFHNPDYDRLFDDIEGFIRDRIMQPYPYMNAFMRELGLSTYSTVNDLKRMLRCQHGYT